MTTASGSWNERFHQRCFDALYSRSLLYNACWEDPACDRVALDLRADDEVLVITSGGCNALDYALCAPRRVVAVDANPRQGALLELKIAAIRAGSDADVFAMFGHGWHPGARDLYQRRLRTLLSPAAQAIWDRQIGWFCGRFGDRFYYHGLSGLVARLMRGYILTQPGLRRAMQHLLAATSLSEQQTIYDCEVAPRLWGRFLMWAVSRQSTMSLLGVPPAQTRDVAAQGRDRGLPADEESTAAPVSRFVRDSIDRVFRELPLGSNYFWTCYLRGGYTRDNCPEYLKPHNLARLRGGLLDRIEVRTGTVTGILAADPRPFSRFVLLDHMDWMGTHRQPELAEEWQWLFHRAAPNARALFRSAQRRPQWIDTLHLPSAAPNSSAPASGGPSRGPSTLLSERLRFNLPLAAELHARDRVGTYGGVHIADLQL